MAEKVDRNDWSSNIADTVGQQVKRFRERPEWKLSAQALADRTRDLGYEVKRSVIANLESGRRGTVSVADVLVLAAALDVPPSLLVFPIGTQKVMHALPGVTVDPWAAHQWWLGSRQILEIDAEPNSEEHFRRSFARRESDKALRLYARHRGLLNQLENLESAKQHAEQDALESGELDPDLTNQMRQQTAQIREKITESLRSIETAGLLAPQEGAANND